LWCGRPDSVRNFALAGPPAIWLSRHGTALHDEVVEHRVLPLLNGTTHHPQGIKAWERFKLNVMKVIPMENEL
jgi:hypothetical protein